MRQLANSGGEVVLARAYDPYGSLVENNAYDGVSTAYGYAGEFTDASGMVYLRARYYSPIITQFIQADTKISDPLKPWEWNLYIYGRNNPINLVDPSGYQSCKTPGECAELTLKYIYQINLGTNVGNGFSDEEKTLILDTVSKFANFLGGTSKLTNNISLVEIFMDWWNNAGDWGASYINQTQKIQLPPGWYSPIIAQDPSGAINIYLNNPCVEDKLHLPDDSLPSDKIEAQFVLAHELGHSFSARNEKSYQSFIDNVNLPPKELAMFNSNPLIKRNAMREYFGSDVFSDMVAAYLYSPGLLNQQMRDWIQIKMRDSLY
ncbi:MAG: RHS repeat-associated core domain-containing protein [Chloroflexi bacterium]|nr:RHS repeat-associated core domain-containing protein [Chloroflexota bacterium]